MASENIFPPKRVNSDGSNYRLVRSAIILRFPSRFPPCSVLRLGLEERCVCWEKNCVDCYYQSIDRRCVVGRVTARRAALGECSDQGNYYALSSAAPSRLTLAGKGKEGWGVGRVFFPGKYGGPRWEFGDARSRKFSSANATGRPVGRFVACFSSIEIDRSKWKLGCCCCCCSVCFCRSRIAADARLACPNVRLIRASKSARPVVGDITSFQG